jgi:hypothetical protein
MPVSSAFLTEGQLQTPGSTFVLDDNARPGAFNKSLVGQRSKSKPSELH